MTPTLSLRQASRIPVGSNCADKDRTEFGAIDEPYTFMSDYPPRSWRRLHTPMRLPLSVTYQSLWVGFSMNDQAAKDLGTTLYYSCSCWSIRKLPAN